ncbi:MAG: hypothetical protein U9N00_03665 [Candidatus Bipolaricaulota bacterium]|nr:hypothetical protein [Candidatus Bipolaricaulota bacterium]
MSAKRALFIIIGAVLMIVVTLLFLFPLRDFVRVGLVEPLITAYYIARWYLHRLPQLLLWAGLVLGASYFLFRAYHQAFPLAKQRVAMRRITTPLGSDLQWLQQVIARARKRAFSRRLIASNLVHTAVRLIARREGLSLDEARERFETFEWCDDLVVKEFFRYRRTHYGWRRGVYFSDKLQRTISFLERYQQGV